MDQIRLGDVIDDYCVKCRRLTNHAIVSIVEGAAAKVRCRTCYHDHDYRHEQPPPSKKDLKKAELFNQVLSGSGIPTSDEESTAVTQEPDPEPEPEVASSAHSTSAKKRPRKTSKPEIRS
jgi:hypothetical protein